MKKLTLVLLVVLIWLSSACQPQSAPEAEDAFCQSLADFHQTLQPLTEINASSDREQIKTDLETAQKAWLDVQEAGQEMREANLSDLELAVANLGKTIQAALGVASLEDSLAGIQKAVDDVQTAMAELQEVNCPTP
jgi:soluble cytochrome b562